MKRKTFASIILYTVGGLVFALGMCMTMVWQGLMIPGVVVGIVGIVLLLCLIPAIKGFKE